MYGLPACYWLIDEGEEKDSEEEMERERQTIKKIESINLLSCAFVYLANSPFSELMP